MQVIKRKKINKINKETDGVHRPYASDEKKKGKNKQRTDGVQRMDQMQLLKRKKRKKKTKNRWCAGQ
jgi:hypothetical protein